MRLVTWWLSVSIADPQDDVTTIPYLRTGHQMNDGHNAMGLECSTTIAMRMLAALAVHA